ncbi:17796_t:CDS:2 [Funneliformis geosporum]|uniref:2868_t:CDS:1 n=1 Tax=Funneliformis geosporum TaxID=1117311 RepID=A0A9W4SKC3_9GLOM|nr:2868_t:CDS:2 [Funneliformis geosporum]CAI2176753.1 17796_t:CDS:2 [Funneliformis geosporum]
MASSKGQTSEQTQISNTPVVKTEPSELLVVVKTEENITPTASSSSAPDIGMTESLSDEDTKIPLTPDQIEEEKKKILRQVEYYFSDMNLPKDRFLNEVRSKNPKGWIPLKMICKFKKMQVYKDYNLIVETLRESPNLLEVDEKGEHVRRKTPVMIDIPQHIKDSTIWRSIYVKGFNKEEIDSNYEKEVASFFSQFSKVEKSFARRKDDGTYKDSFFVQFVSHEEAKKVSEMILSYKDAKLHIMMKFDYCEMKCIEKGLDPNTMRLQKPTVKKEKRPHTKMASGCLLHFEGAGPNSTYSTIRTQMHNDFGEVIFVQYDPQTLSGVIQFEKPIAHEVIESPSFEKLRFDNVQPKLRVLKDEEEKEYYRKKRSDRIERVKQGNALKAEYGIIPEEKNKNTTNNTTNQNARGKKGRRFNHRKNGRNTEKRSTESNDQKRKSDGDDKDAAVDDQSPTKKLRASDPVAQDIPDILPSISSSSSASGVKRKSTDANSPDLPEEERPKTPKLEPIE